MDVSLLPVTNGFLIIFAPPQLRRVRWIHLLETQDRLPRFPAEAKRSIFPVVPNNTD